MKSPRRRQRGQVLILIALGALFLSAAGAGVLNSGRTAHELREALAKRVTDADRRQRAEAVLDRIEKESEALAKAHDRLGREALALMQRHDATRAEFDPVLERADELNARSRRALAYLRFELREGLSAEDWRAMFADAPR